MLAQLGRHLETVGMPEVEKAVVKATFRDEEPPKEKHMLALVDFSFKNRMTLHDICGSLRLRLKSSRWEVLLKAQTVLHRLLREGSAEFSREMTREHQAVDFERFHDDSSYDSWHYSKICVAYGAYLVEKIRNYKLDNVFAERRVQESGTDWIRTLDCDHLFRVAAAVQRQFKLLLSISFSSGGSAIHPITAKCYIQLLKDSIHLHTFQSVVVLMILEDFQSWSKSLVATALEFFREFVAQNDEYKAWSSRACALGLIESHLLPELDNVPLSIIDVLSATLDSSYVLPSEKRSKSKGAHGKKSKSRVKKMTKNASAGSSKRAHSSKKEKKADFEADFLGLSSNASAAAPSASKPATDDVFDLLSWDAPQSKQKQKKPPADTFDTLFM